MCLRHVLAGLALAAALFTTGCAGCPCGGGGLFHHSNSSKPCCNSAPTSCCSEGGAPLSAGVQTYSGPAPVGVVQGK
jgi:hypothetical protein